ncbi:MAG: nucleoside-diphosphate kinase [Rickettsiales bacterium]|nr:nucleoside-diphosphate kinase [Rickettsiales bacterium]
MIERTLSIIKPDAVERGLEGSIVTMIEESGFKIVAQKKVWLTKTQAELFYREHSAKGFFNDLTDFMSRSPIVVQILEKENAVVDYRTLMGTTDPKNADKNTIRKQFGKSISENSVHGSDNIESAYRETHFFFSDIEVYR